MEALLGSFTSFGHDDAHERYQHVYHTEVIHPHHKASFTHEAIAGAAGFAAMKAYESHLRATGHQPSHMLMKEILAGIAAAEVDKLVETKGLDWIDRHKAKKLAERQAHDLAEHRYRGATGWEYAQSQGGYAEEYTYQGRVPWQTQEYGGYSQPAQGGYYPPPQGYPPPQQYYQGQQGYGLPEYGGYPAPGYQQGYEREHHEGHHHHEEHHRHEEEHHHHRHHHHG